MDTLRHVQRFLCTQACTSIQNPLSDLFYAASKLLKQQTASCGKPVALIVQIDFASGSCKSQEWGSQLFADVDWLNEHFVRCAKHVAQRFRLLWVR